MTSLKSLYPVTEDWKSASEEQKEQTLWQLSQLSECITTNWIPSQLTISYIQISFIEIRTVEALFAICPSLTFVHHPAYPDRNASLHVTTIQLQQLLEERRKGKKKELTDNIKVICKFLEYMHPISKKLHTCYIVTPQPTFE